MTATNNGRAELPLPPEVVTCLKTAFAAQQKVEVAEAAKDGAESAYQQAVRQQRAAAQAHRLAEANLEQARQDLLGASLADVADRWEAYQASLADEAEVRAEHDRLQRQLALARRDRDQTRQAFEAARKTYDQAEGNIDQTSRRLVLAG